MLSEAKSAFGGKQVGSVEIPQEVSRSEILLRRTFLQVFKRGGEFRKSSARA
ncbi:MAG: hypothetical protein UV59_C0003G0033 [Candidatus Gottesmanbacteria bacterium GW2011_GWA1_43_11]|uniref:Uncharacterized protein n=1 Tax=Candidatus Gottesmanbacteria bacterium GW2011_GWA1_43_11 TaxID=1618436 RepID=A0A0G1FGR5_9BACT|nr:MAG: hypothetical protein UV59_C0003G0033 [Candidatus Gottesmanbacteria bacterium GW2011_GWA1_43_11]